MLTRAHEPEAQGWYEAGLWRREDLWTDIAGQAARVPDRVAVRCGEQELTYGALVRAAAALSTRLADAGVGHGDVVAMLGRHGVEAAVAMAAGLHRGALIAPVPPMFSAAQLSALIGQCGAKALIGFGSERELATCAQLAGEVPVHIPLDPAAVAELVAAGDEAARAAREPLDADAPTLVLHSSGTTSEPKGVVHSSNTVRYTAQQIHERWELTGEDVHLVICEFGFVDGIHLVSLRQ